jgi:hypothetical protein
MFVRSGCSQPKAPDRHPTQNQASREHHACPESDKAIAAGTRLRNKSFLLLFFKKEDS